MENNTLKVKRLVLGSVMTNTYFVYNDKKDLVIIDPADIALVEQEIKNIGISPSAVLNTHGHFDHIIGNGVCDCGVFIQEQDEKMLFSAQGNLSALFGDQEVIFEKGSLRINTIEDGDVLSFGGLKFEVFHSPGHTQGSVCFRIGKFLFTGDTLFKGAIGRVDLPGASEKKLFSSLERLLDIDEDLKVMPGHGAETNLKAERGSNIFLLGRRVNR